LGNACFLCTASPVHQQWLAVQGEVFSIERVLLLTSEVCNAESENICVDPFSDVKGAYKTRS